MKKYWVYFVLILAKAVTPVHADVIVMPSIDFERGRLFFVIILVLGVFLLTRLIQKRLRR